MPFTSKAQMKAAFGGYIKGFSKERAKKWADETPNISGLPEHVKSRSKSYQKGFSKGQKIAGKK